MMRHRNQSSFAAAATVAAALVNLLAAPPLKATPPDPLEPASSGGLAALDRTLARLSTHKRLLVMAAHPDDEDTRLLTYVARGLGGEAAYLSLSRGDGGQNLIGPELGVGLGLLRSRELLAARRVDGARQFFTRAYDFGYTRSLVETFERWPRHVLHEDAVRVIRLFQPQVLVTVFPPSSRAGHGQHWASGVVAPECLELAADARAFPELGLAPHEIQAFYRAAFFDRASATLEVPLGTIEPFSGRSIFQLSMASRSQHRCQDMGLVQPLGDATGALAWQAGGDGAGSIDVFSGIDTRLQAVAAPLPPARRKRVAERLDRVGELARGARARLSAVDTVSAAAPLQEIVGLLREAEAELAGEEPVTRQVRSLVAEKLALAYEGLANAAGVLADAVTEQETAVPGGSFAVRSIFWNAGSLEVSDLEVSVASAAGWRETGRAKPEAPRSFFSTRVSDEQEITVEVPAGSPPTVPYFLRRPLVGDLYDWSVASPEERGRPFGPPPLVLRFVFRLGGVPVALEREVVYRVRDQAKGEIRRPLRAVPRLEVTVEPDLLVWPIGESTERSLQVEVRSNAGEALAANLEVTLPDGWPAPAPVRLEVAPGGRKVVEVVLRAPAELRESRYEVAVAALTDDGERFDHAYPLVDYEHIRPTPMPRPARVTISAAKIAFPALGRLGCVRGAGDRVPEFLRAVGFPVEVLSAAELTGADLSVYDTITIGSRAYETDASLHEANPRLLAYVKRGGTLVVQYQQYQFVRGGYAPFELVIHRPHDRVTDETAAVRLLAPEHPALTTPNRITAADWEGWVQERGLYFARSWGEEATPLLAMADPGDESEKDGSLIVARHGEGYYVYTGLAFFRQLPAGVPGAYRLFTNLLALGADGGD